MSKFFAYDELTWPEIAALDRCTPLIIPLGTGYSFAQLSNALGNPDRIGMLPPLPFGWIGSGLSVPEHLLSKLVSNLVNSLRDDGFPRVHTLTPQGMELDLTCHSIPLPFVSDHDSDGYAQSGNKPLAWKAIPADSERDKAVIIPIGHTEQHGYHLPMSTDTLIIEAIGMGVSQATPGNATTLPAFPYGVSTHREGYAGTLNAGGRAFEDFWLGVIDTLVLRGFTRMYLLSGHGGNSSFLVNVIKYAGERHMNIFCATAWLYLSGPAGIAALDRYRQSQPGGMGHACELETSLILHLRPDLVHMQRVVDETDYISTPSYYMDWVEGGALIANPHWYDDSKTGAYGAGSLGTAQKGRLWLEAAISEKVSHVAEIHEQYQRRIERRKDGYGAWGHPS